MEVYLIEAKKQYNSLRYEVNNYCSKYDSFELILCTFGLTCILCYIWFAITTPHSKKLSQRFKEYIFRHARKIPFINNKMNSEVVKTCTHFKKEMSKHLGDKRYYTELPRKGLEKEFILESVEKYKVMGAIRWKEGMISGAIYKRPNIALEEMITKISGSMAYTNPLHADVFPGLRVMEAEVVRMVCSAFEGDENCCGTVTSGGTESIFLACKAYRDYAITERGIVVPEMVIPVTAHAAFDKAAQILQMRIRHVRVDPVSMKVDVKAMKKMINKSTCMLVGSVPQFPHGIIDDIDKIAELGLKYNIPVHMDGCLGGFLLPFMKEAGFELPMKCNFNLKGLTSISVDSHKYGYTPKGTSIILYRDSVYRHYQYSVQPDWPGGIYATPNLGGSRAGATIATCWASLLYYGFEGYVQETKKIIATTRYIVQELKKIPEIWILGEPLMSVIGVGSKTFEVYRLGQELGHLGWNLNSLQFPNGFHLCVTQLHTEPGVADRFLKDIKECVASIMKVPDQSPTGTAALYGMAQTIPDRKFVSELACAFLDAYYSTEYPDEQ